MDRILTNTDGSLVAGRAFNVSCSIPEKELDDVLATEIGDGQAARALPMPIFILLTYVNVIGYWLTGTAPINPLMTLMALEILKLKFHTYSSARARKEIGWKPTPWKNIVKRIVKEWQETEKQK